MGNATRDVLRATSRKIMSVTTVKYDVRAPVSEVTPKG